MRRYDEEQKYGAVLQDGLWVTTEKEKDILGTTWRRTRHARFIITWDYLFVIIMSISGIFYIYHLFYQVVHP